MSYGIYLSIGGIIVLVLLAVYASYKAKKMEEELDRIVEEESQKENEDEIDDKTEG